MKRLKGEQLPMFPGASYEAKVLYLPLPEQHERPKQEVLMWEQTLWDLDDAFVRMCLSEWRPILAMARKISEEENNDNSGDGSDEQ